LVKWLVTVVVIAMLLGASAGIFFWMYTEAKAELDEVKTELTDLAKLTDIQAELDDTMVELTKTQAELDDTKVELTDTQAELRNTRNDLTSTTANLTTISTELNQLKEVYPPRHFANLSELRGWVREHTPVTNESYDLYEKQLKLQEEAFTDGFIWSVYWGAGGRTMGVVRAGDGIYYCYSDGLIEWQVDKQVELLP